MIDPLKHPVKIVKIFKLLYEDHKLIPTKTTDGILSSQKLLEVGTYTFEYLITCRMAVSIIDRFEVVQVTEDKADMFFKTFGMFYRVIQPVIEQNSVGESGEGIMCCKKSLFLCVFAVVCYIGKYSDVIFYLSLAVPDRIDTQPLYIYLAIFFTVGDLPLPVPFIVQLIPHLLIELLIMVA